MVRLMYQKVHGSIYKNGVDPEKDLLIDLQKNNNASFETNQQLLFKHFFDRTKPFRDISKYRSPLLMRS